MKYTNNNLYTLSKYINQYIYIYIYIYMMLFSTGTGLERVWAVGLDQGYWWVELEDAGSFGAG